MESVDYSCDKTLKKNESISNISKSALKKTNNHAKIIALRRERRKEKKLERKARLLKGKEIANSDGSKSSINFVDNERVTKKEMKEIVNKRLIDARGNAPIVCVDISYNNSMSLKEQTKLRMQLCRLYGSNKKATSPFHVYFSSLDVNSDFYKQCCLKNEGFASYIVDETEKSPMELFACDKIIQLSPDAPDCLENVTKDNVYVLGGIVDENVSKELSISKANFKGIKSMSLPIEKYLKRAEKGTYSKVLSINQVFEILLAFYESKDWTKSLLDGIPKRAGFIPKTS